MPWGKKQETIGVYDTGVPSLGTAALGSLQKAGGNNTLGNFKLAFAGGPTTAVIGFNPTGAQVVAAINLAFGETVVTDVGANPNLNTGQLAFRWLGDRQYNAPAMTVADDTTDNGVATTGTNAGTLPDPLSTAPGSPLIWVGRDATISIGKADGGWTSVV